MNPQPLTEEDLRWVVCPVCHKLLQTEAGEVRCQGCGGSYPIVNGIPVLLVQRAL
jgi:uncharacterized protein YbaR (Trm112 family)